MQDKPTFLTVLVLILLSWTFSISLALVPVLPQLQSVFADRALLQDNSFFPSKVTYFAEAKNWSEKLLTYDPSFTHRSPEVASHEIETATSWHGLRSALGDAKWAEILETNNYFG